MKKILAAVLCLIVTVMLAVPASALALTDNTIENAFDTLPAEYANATVVALADFYEDAVTNAHAGSTEGQINDFNYVYLKADGLGDYTVPFTVDKDGVYDFAFNLMGWAASVLRSTNVRIDDSENVYIAYDYADDNQYHNHYWYGISANLTAGEHTLTLSLADDFDNETVKSLYFADFMYVYSANQPAAETEAPAVVETAAPETEAPAAEAPVQTPAAQTADLAAASIAIFAAAAIVLVATKKNH